MFGLFALFALFALLTKGWFALVLRNEAMPQTTFQVQDIVNRRATSVVVFVECGGVGAISEGNEVRIYGKLNSNGVVFAKQGEIHRHNGIELNPVSVIKGKSPPSLIEGLIWLGISFMPLIYIFIAFKS